MKRVGFSIALAFFIFGIAGEPGNTQTRRRRPRSKPQVVEPDRSSAAINSASNEENVKIIEDCSLPGRPRPEAAIKMAVRCGKAISLPRPPYPEAAKAAKVSGAVTVEIVIDEKGRVVWANAVNGHPLLQAASVWAACRARYSPMKISGQVVKVNSVIVYNFLDQ